MDGPYLRTKRLVEIQSRFAGNFKKAYLKRASLLYPGSGLITCGGLRARPTTTRLAPSSASHVTAITHDTSPQGSHPFTFAGWYLLKMRWTAVARDLCGEAVAGVARLLSGLVVFRNAALSGRG